MVRFSIKKIRIREIYASISEWTTMILIASVQIHLLFKMAKNPSFSNVYIAQILVLLLISLLLFGYYLSHKTNLAKIKERLTSTATIKFIVINDVLIVVFTLLGAIAIYFAKRWIELPPILLASAITLLSSFLINTGNHEMLKNYDFAFYAGIFVGLTSNFSHALTPILMAALLSGILFILSKNLLVGVGGRLGSFAFVAIWITSLCFF